MMNKSFIKDDFAKVYKKYTQAGPNYQCFPTTLDFQDEIKQKVIIKKLVGLEGNEINLQLFSPFCHDPHCHVTSYQIQMLDDSQLNTYIEYLKNEILIYKKFINNVKIVGIHFSGSEISLIESLKLSQLLSFIATSFEVNLDDVDLSIDINVRLIDIKKLKALKNMGFNRLRFSTLNFNYHLKISKEISQSYQHVDKLLQETKKLDFDSIIVELQLGLPDETYESIEDTINTLIALNCEHILLSHYIHRPYIFKLQKSLNLKHIATENENYFKFKMCVDKLLSARYKHLGMNCFVNDLSQLYCAQENKRLNYNHTGYTLNPVNDVISFGASSISKIDGYFFQNIVNISDYYQSLDNLIFPAFRGCSLTADHIFRKNIIKSLIINNRFDNKSTSKKQLEILKNCKSTCAHLNEMEKDGLVNLSLESIQVTELGRYFLKNICALFDLNMKNLISYNKDN